MERIPDSRYSELIEDAYSCIPPNIAKLVSHVHFFCGTDPVYAGIIKDDKFVIGGEHHSHRDWMYYVQDYSKYWNVSKQLRHPTIVIPRLDMKLYIDQVDIIHELGHALDYALPFDIIDIVPVTEYAKQDNVEAFAEAFTSWLCWDYGKLPTGEVLDLFERLKEKECGWY